MKDYGIREKQEQLFFQSKSWEQKLNANEGNSSRPFNVLILNFRNAGLLHMMI
jgi:hypothetical protein